MRSQLQTEPVFPGLRASWLPAGLGLFFILHAAILTIFLLAPRLAASISSPEIKPETGLAYAVAVPRTHLFYQAPSDTPEVPNESDLALFEDGRPLGPPHTAHADIRKSGGGRYSHWRGSIIFSSSDGSDPRSNGRRYSIASKTAPNPTMKIVALMLLAADIALGFGFRRHVYVFLRRRGAPLVATLAVLAIGLAGLIASGRLGVLTVARDGPAKDAALTILALEHALLGLLAIWLMWAAGAGVCRLVWRDPKASLPDILIPAFPVGLLLLAMGSVISLVIPGGRQLTLAAAFVCILPLAAWRPPGAQISAALKAIVSTVPLAICFGLWLGLLWHGPTETLSGNPTGDLVYYASRIWTLAEHLYPLRDLAYENGGSRHYFNTLFPALGASLSPLPGFDPFLFLLAGGGAACIACTSQMVFLYVADRAGRPFDAFAAALLVVALLAAGRYPYWVVESIHVVFMPALTIAVYWMARKAEPDVRRSIAAMTFALAGSMLTKAAAASVLVPLGAAQLWPRFRSYPRSTQAMVAGLGCLFGIYCITMLSRYLPAFLGIANLGPRSLVHPAWYVISRDVGCVLLAVLAWRVVDRATAVGLILGIVSFLVFAFVFEINLVCVIVVLGLAVFPNRNAHSRIIALIAFLSVLPAVMLTDPAGGSSGIAWGICLGGAVLLAILSAGHRESKPLLPLRMSALIAVTTLVIGGLGLAGVISGTIIVNSGYGFGPALSPDVRDIWSAVRRLVPRDALIFTDQVDESTNLLGGWNTYAVSGQRQIYLSSYYTSFELRTDKEKLQAKLGLNARVLRGALKPSEVPTRYGYNSAFAVVSVSRATPAGWRRIYDNGSYAIFQIVPY